MSTTTDLKHTATLMEQHRISFVVSGDDGLDTFDAEAAAEAWADAHGLDLLDVKVFSTYGRGDVTEAGVTFTVTVGKGDISPDQRMPGVLDSWRWSAGRFEWWRKVFNRADGRQGRILVAREEDNTRVIRFPGPVPAVHPSDLAPVDQRPPWQRRAEGWDEDDVTEAEPTHRQLIDQAEARRLAAFDREDTILHATEASPGYVGVRLSGKRCGDCYAIGGHTSECRWSQ